MSLEALLTEVEKEGLSNDVKRRLFEAYGDRFLKAMKLIEAHRIKKYICEPSGREFWIIVGKERDYLIIPRLYCSCEDFYINVVTRRKVDLCYHLLSQALASSLKNYDSFKLMDNECDFFMKEWKKQGIR